MLVHDRTYFGRMALGARIRETRERASLSIADLATRAEISYSYLSDVERGRRLPTLQVLDALAGSLDQTVLSLLRGLYPWDISNPPDTIAPLPDGRRRVRR